MKQEEKEDFAVRFVRFIVGILVLSTWFIIGLIVWIPMLFRVVSIYSFLIIPLSFTGNKTALKRISSMLNDASVFYVKGFNLALRTIRLQEDEITQANEVSDESTISVSVFFAQTFKEILISLVFWGIFCLAFEFNRISAICAATFVVVVIAWLIMKAYDEDSAYRKVHKECLDINGFRETDQALNALYENLLSKLPEPRAMELKTAQESWMKSCAEMVKGDRNPHATLCDWTAQRKQQLEVELKGLTAKAVAQKSSKRQ